MAGYLCVLCGDTIDHLFGIGIFQNAAAAPYDTWKQTFRF